MLLEGPGRGVKERAQNVEERALDKVFLIILEPIGPGRTPSGSLAHSNLLAPACGSGQLTRGSSCGVSLGDTWTLREMLRKTDSHRIPKRGLGPLARDNSVSLKQSVQGLWA